MADQTLASSPPTVIRDGEDEATDKEFSDALTLDGEDAAPDKDASAAAGDRDAAVELLLEEIQGLKNDRSDLQHKCADLQHKCADLQHKCVDLQHKCSDLQDELLKQRTLHVTDQSNIESFAAQVSRLEGDLRLAQDDLSSANITVAEYEEEIHRLQSSYKELEGKFNDKVQDLEAKVTDLEKKVVCLKDDLADKDKKFQARELELEELRYERLIDMEKSREINGRDDSVAPLIQSHAVGAVALVGVGILAAGAIVCLHLAKRS